MAHISKAEHPRILQLVDSEYRKVAEVAAEYGCTPANIYALLSKLRRQAAPGGETVSTREKSADTSSQSGAETHVSPPEGESGIGLAVPDLFTPGPKPVAAAVHETKADSRRKRPDAGTERVTDAKTSERAPASPMAVQRQEPEVVASPPTRSAVTQISVPVPGRKGGGLGAGLAKPGMALVMRTAEGEENMTRFRSLDDLLSTVKPILRAAARSPDAVWFSIQPVDLASLDSDLA